MDTICTARLTYYTYLGTFCQKVSFLNLDCSTHHMTVYIYTIRTAVYRNGIPIPVIATFISAIGTIILCAQYGSSFHRFDLCSIVSFICGGWVRTSGGYATDVDTGVG